MIRYFGGLGKSKLILWCYLAWYVAIVAQYFDPSPILWISSVGIALVIGLALNLSTRQANHRPEGWVVFRLFLMPFCVSSYSALIKGKGFILLFPREARPLLVGLLACAAVIALHLVCGLILRRLANAAPPLSS
ncbi:MAG: hypothetical protein ABI233_00425 [Chthoniobacterales bacterium]